MKYVKATVEVVEFDNTDIITTSGECGDMLHKNYDHICPNAQSTVSASTDDTQW